MSFILGQHMPSSTVVPAMFSCPQWKVCLFFPCITFLLSTILSRDAQSR